MVGYSADCCRRWKPGINKVSFGSRVGRMECGVLVMNTEYVSICRSARVTISSSGFFVILCAECLSLIQAFSKISLVTVTSVYDK